MIFDSIENLTRYSLPFEKDIAAFLNQNEWKNSAFDEIQIRGRELFVRYASYETRTAEEGKFETHQMYMDIQYILSGTEIIQTAPSYMLASLTSYDEESDCRFFMASEGISSLVIRANEFAVFWPGEAHRPSCSLQETAGFVKKIIFKIKISEKE